MSISVALRAFTMPASGGHRFALLFERAAHHDRGTILYVPPFAEEMNKSRRMMARQARAYAAAGFDVLCIDLLGTGDSSGDSGDASWSAWLDDLALGYEWLARERGARAATTSLWALRAGALLAGDFAARQSSYPSLVLWQPVLAGNVHLQQFLRLRTMSGLSADRDPANSAAALKAALARGESIEIAGYMLNPALADAMLKATLEPPPAGARVLWQEVTAGGELAPASITKIATWRGAGVDVKAQAFDGAPFWQTQEIEECEALLTATTAAITDPTTIAA